MVRKKKVKFLQLRKQKKTKVKRVKTFKGKSIGEVLKERKKRTAQRVATRRIQ